jgi:hypothetical protein
MQDELSAFEAFYKTKQPSRRLVFDVRHLPAARVRL